MILLRVTTLMISIMAVTAYILALDPVNKKTTLVVGILGLAFFFIPLRLCVI